MIFEAKLKELVMEEPLVHAFWGYGFESLIDNEDSVVSTVVDPSGNLFSIKSKYVIGCDGAGSQVRLSVGIKSPRRSL